MLKKFSEADLPGSLGLPLGLSANGIKIGVDAGVLWVYLSQLIIVIGGPRYLSIGFFAVVPIAYAVRRRKGKSTVAPLLKGKTLEPAENSYDLLLGHAPNTAHQ